MDFKLILFLQNQFVLLYRPANMEIIWPIACFIYVPILKPGQTSWADSLDEIRNINKFNVSWLTHSRNETDG